MGKRNNYNLFVRSSNRNNPYETDNDCGNCDGANCDICNERQRGDELEFRITSDELHDILKKKNLPKEVVDSFAYDDYCNRFYHYNDETYYFVWPSIARLKRNYPKE